MAALEERLGDVRAAGADVVLVGVGTPEQARAFRALTRWKGILLTDPEGRAYAAVRLRKMSLWSVLSPRLIRNVFKARKEGFRQTKTSGDPRQLGGTIVVGPGDRVLFSWPNANVDEEASLHDVVAALRARSA